MSDSQNMSDEVRARLRAISSVNELLAEWPVVKAAGETCDAVVHAAVTAELDEERAAIRAGAAPRSKRELASAIEWRAHRSALPSLRPAVNATGVVIHTNLGRAPLAESAAKAVAEVARGYSTLEYSVDTCSRGSRKEHAAQLIRSLTGAEDALVVNNNAAAVLLVLALTAYLKLHKRPKVFFWCKVAFAAVLVVGAAGGVYAVSHMGGGLDPDQLTMTYPNGDSIWTFSFGYICRNIPATVKLLLRTLPEQGALWLQGLLGTTLGEPIVYRIDVSWLLGVGLLLAVLAAALPRQDEPALLGRRSKAGTAGICLCVVLAVLAAALNWTPINYQTLFGLQGRYLLPILPLALLLVKSSKKLVLRGDVSHAAALCTSTLTMLTLLQGFGLYAAWQPAS